MLGLVALIFGLGLFVFVGQQQQNLSSKAAPAASDQTDRTNLSFTGSKYTSQYHLYAAGLDWSKSVGLLLYTDGSGEFGLKNLSEDYLMAGSTGMIAVAKKHNMILLTPLSPNKACSDGDGSCWYMEDPEGYIKWAEELVTKIQSQYPIDKNRIAVGGYSSGAQFSTEYWVPSGAAQRTMTDGVIVAISYGGRPQMKEVGYTSTFKSNVHMAWNTGDQDEAYMGDGVYGVKAGYDYYTAAGFQTSLDVLPGVSHDRSGDFGPVMDAMITKYVPPATAAAPTTAVVPTNVDPTYFCGGSGNCIPSGQPTEALPNPYTTEAPYANPTEIAQPTVVYPTDTPQDPEITTTPNNNNNPGNGNNNNNGRKGGIFAFIFAFLEIILRFLQSLFGR